MATDPSTETGLARADERAALAAWRAQLAQRHAEVANQLAAADADLAALDAADAAEAALLDTPLHRGEVDEAGQPVPPALTAAPEVGRVAPPERTRFRVDEAGNSVYVPGVDTPVSEAGIPL